MRKIKNIIAYQEKSTNEHNLEFYCEKAIKKNKAIEAINNLTVIKLYEVSLPFEDSYREIELYTNEEFNIYEVEYDYSKDIYYAKYMSIAENGCYIGTAGEHSFYDIYDIIDVKETTEDYIINLTEEEFIEIIDSLIDEEKEPYDYACDYGYSNNTNLICIERGFGGTKIEELDFNQFFEDIY